MRFLMVIVALLFWYFSFSQILTYDEFGRVHTIIYRDNTKISYTYDVNGNRITSTINPCYTKPKAAITPPQSTTICSSDSVILKADSAFSYKWSTGATTRSITVKISGIDTLVVKDEKGCPDTTSITVTVKPSPIVTVSSTKSVLCAGGYDTLKASGATTYVWHGLNNSDSISSTIVLIPPIGDNTYTVIGTTDGCSTSQSVTVTVNPLPKDITPFTTTSTICVQSNGMIKVPGSEKTVQYQLKNTTTGGVVGSPIIGTGDTLVLLTGALTSATTFAVIATVVQTGCTRQLSGTVTFTTIPKPTILISSSPSSACQGSPLSLSATGAQSYVWSGQGLTATTGMSVIAIPTVSGTTTYKAIGTAANGCIDSATIAIPVNPSPPIASQPIASQAVCVGGTVDSLKVKMVDPGYYIYQWYRNSSNSTVGGTQITAALDSVYRPSSGNAGTTYYYCVITKPNVTCPTSVSSIASVAVFNKPSFTTQPTASQIVCHNGVAPTLSIATQGGTGTITYQWYSNSQNTTTGTIISGATSNSYLPSTATIGTKYYYCVATASGIGCGSVASNIATVTTIPTTTPAITISSNCVGTTAVYTTTVVSGGSAPQYQWQLKKSGVWVDSVSATAATLSVLNTASNEFVRCRLISTATCAIPQTVYSDSMTLNCSVTAIVPIVGLEAFSITPNPSKSSFVVQLKLNTIKSISFRLYDASGKILREITPSFNAGTVSQTINVRNMPSGTYYLITQIGKQNRTDKVVIER